MTRLIVAIGFSLLYAGMYPVLTGGGVIYHYPYWASPLAATYVLGGILLQAWFCFARRRRSRHPYALWSQIVTGLGYVAALAAFPGGIYQS